VSLLTVFLLFPLFIASILFLPMSVLLAIGLLPTVAALLIDRDPQRYTFITVGLMNVAGVIPQLVKLWIAGMSMDHAMTIISDPLAWLTMYGAATLGWFIFFSVPPFLQAIINQKTKLRIASLDHKQTAMIKEWGEDLRSGIEAGPPIQSS
jgi:hypothetical protein